VTTSVLDGATPEHWQIVLDNTGLVWRHVNRMRLVESCREDAYQDGLLGLLRAAMLFDPDRGYTFATYADAWIRQYIAKGRARVEGKNYRRAVASGDTYTPPESLDADLGSDNGFTLAELLPDRTDPCDDVERHLALDVVLAGCNDSIDLAILGLMALDGGVPLREIAEDNSVSVQTVRNRRLRLRHLASTAVTVEDAA